MSSLSPEDIKSIDEIRAFRRFHEVSIFNKEINISAFEEQWQVNKSIWLKYLKDLCPFIDAADISTWAEYTHKFHKSLQNDLETTINPTIIQDIYFEAKLWDDFRKRHLKLDKRRDLNAYFQ